MKFCKSIIFAFSISFFAFSKPCQNFKEKVISLLKKNEPTVLIEANLLPANTDLINQNTILDPLVLSTVYQYGILYALYSRPIDITDEGNYSSKIFKKFEYDHLTKTLTLIMNQKLKFSDGQDITAEEVALTISRVALLRSSLEPYNLIKGMSLWRNSLDPLKNFPKGIKVKKNPNLIEITFLRNPEDPFYWLTFPMLSIIPRSCINLKTTHVICKHPPLSGLYRISKIDKNIISLLIKDRAEKRYPKKLHFVFLVRNHFPDFLDYFNTYHVFELQDGFSFYGGFEAQIKKRFKLTGYTENWASLIIFDRHSEAFRKKRVRQLFSQTMREVLKNLGKNVSGSIIPVLSPGYLDIGELRDGMKPFNEREKKEIIENLKKFPPNLGEFGEINKERFFFIIAKKTADSLGIPLESTGSPNFSFRKVCFENREPIHAIKFVLRYLSPYKESLSKKLLSSLSMLSRDKVSLNKKINQSIFLDATISVLMGYGRMQILRKDSPLKFKEQFLRQDWQRFFEEQRKIEFYIK